MPKRNDHDVGSVGGHCVIGFEDPRKLALLLKNNATIAPRSLFSITEVNAKTVFLYASVVSSGVESPASSTSASSAV
jgi:hypothetical protein